MRVFFILLLALWYPSGVQAAREAYQFDMYRKDKKIGVHQVVVTSEGPRKIVTVIIRIDGKLGPFTLYKYRHKSTETWLNNRLQELSSSTDDDGTPYTVQAVTTPERTLKITGSGGNYELSGRIIPTSYWNPALVQQTQLLDTQKGTVRNVTIRPFNRHPEPYKNTAGLEVYKGVRYIMSGDLNMQLWYTNDGEWVGLRFTHKSETITYRRSMYTDLSALK